MKVGNIVAGLEVVDVKRVNKLNLIQFLKEVDSYLQQGYKLDVNSARQVGLVLSVDLFKTEAPCSQKAGTTEVTSTVVGSTGVKEGVSKETETKEVTTNVAEETPVKKPTTTRSKKTTQ